jgi:hypothetical protein
VSKSFEIAYRAADKDVRDEIMSEEKLYHLRALVKMKTSVYDFAKKLFGDEIINK